MRTIEYFSSPEMRELYLPGVVTGVAIATLCSLLSVLVVLKRLAFVGQGISHSAFGGVGLAATLGASGAILGAHPLGQFAIVTAFCLAASLLIGAMSKRGQTEGDTAIGIVLVASMALGAVLLSRAARSGGRGVSWESFLFGGILDVAWSDAGLAWGIAAAVLLTLWWIRRPLVFWAFDEPAAQAWGVPARAMNTLLMVMLCLATVTAMKLAGVVLATAMLVLPGAIALRWSRRAGRVLTLAALTAVTSVLGGLVLSFEASWPPGPSIVVLLTALFIITAAWPARPPARTNREPLSSTAPPPPPIIHTYDPNKGPVV